MDNLLFKKVISFVIFNYFHVNLVLELRLQRYNIILAKKSVELLIYEVFPQK